MTPAMRLEAPPPEPSDQTADLKLRFRGAASAIPADNHQRAARFSLLVRLGTDFSASAPSPDQSLGPPLLHLITPGSKEKPDRRPREPLRRPLLRESGSLEDVIEVAEPLLLLAMSGGAGISCCIPALLSPRVWAGIPEEATGLLKRHRRPGVFSAFAG